MNLLLDTHVLLWALADDTQLPGEARAAIVDGRNRVLVSAASTWEITIKQALGKLRAPQDLERAITEARFEHLDISVGHTLAVGALPDHHADPVDRILVAQARTERLTLVTRDPRILRYEVDTLAV